MRHLAVAIMVLALASGTGGTLAAEEPSAVDTFSPTGSLAESRAGHTATLLPDGRVLVVGGSGGPSHLRASAEVWDPATGTFGPAGSLLVPRSGHTATLLSDGRVLVVGGWDGHPSASAELWDPATATFGSAGSLAEKRVAFTASLLPDNRVLVVGGSGGPNRILGAAELWDPTTGMFDPAGSLDRPRDHHAASLLPDGRVLVTGGTTRRERARSVAELWDPTTGMFDPAGSLREARADHTATALSDGRVLVIGGMGDAVGGRGAHTSLSSAEVWDAATASFVAAGSLHEARVEHTATPLPDGRVLVVGGVGRVGRRFDDLASAEVWDPATRTFAPAGSLTQGRSYHTATPLPDGRVLVIGGEDSDGALASAEVWNPSAAQDEG